MPNPFKDWARMYRANKQYLESQGRPSSFFGQIGDIPNRMHEAADATEIGMKMMRHLELTNGAGLPATATVEGVWQVGSYMNMSPVLRIQARVEREDGTEPYVAVFDEVVAQLHMRPDAARRDARGVASTRRTRSTWRSTGSAPVSSAPPPPGSTPGAGGARRAPDLAASSVEQYAQQVVRVVAHQVMGAVQFVDVPMRIVFDAFICTDAVASRPATSARRRNPGGGTCPARRKA